MAPQSQTKPVLLTRAGAKSYLPSGWESTVEINEKLSSSSRRASARRLIDKVCDLVLEQIVVFRMQMSRATKLLVLEEPRYPLVGITRHKKGTARCVLFLHNVVEHDVEDGVRFSLKDILRPKASIKALLRYMTIRGVDTVYVHGETQQHRLREQFPSLNIVEVPLPSSSPVDDLIRSVAPADNATIRGLGSEDFVCLGEIRPNKGYEVAIKASCLSGKPLTILGKSIDVTYFQQLISEASNSSHISVINEFIDTVSFIRAIERSKAVILPYTHFNAQSGVIGKCISLGKPFISADLPSLRQQAGEYPHAYFFAPHDSAELAQLMESFPSVSNNAGTASELSGWETIGRSLVQA